MGRQVCLTTPSCPFIAAAKTSFCCASAAKVLLRRSSIGSRLGCVRRYDESVSLDSDAMLCSLCVCIKSVWSDTHLDD